MWIGGRVGREVLFGQKYENVSESAMDLERGKILDSMIWVLIQEKWR